MPLVFSKYQMYSTDGILTLGTAVFSIFLYQARLSGKVWQLACGNRADSQSVKPAMLPQTCQHPLTLTYLDQGRLYSSHRLSGWPFC